MARKCVAGYPITDTPCEHCGATKHDKCGASESNIRATLRELRDYAAKEITREGARQDPIWAKVAELLK